MIKFIVLGLGAVFGIVGLALVWAKKGDRSKNSIKIGALQLNVAGSSLFVFALGCALIYAVLHEKDLPKSDDKPLVSEQKTNQPLTTPQPPEFVTQHVFPASLIKCIEYETEPGRLPPENIDNFIRLTRAALGAVDQTNQAFQVDVTIRNTGTEPIGLDLDERYFSLEDDHGRAVKLIYFCCPAKGALLPAGEERTIQLFFQAGGWYGKHVSANLISFRVQGFLPLVRGSWQIRTLATAD